LDGGADFDAWERAMVELFFGLLSIILIVLILSAFWQLWLALAGLLLVYIIFAAALDHTTSEGLVMIAGIGGAFALAGGLTWGLLRYSLWREKKPWKPGDPWSPYDKK
jgi:hypothetical protein